MSTRFAPWLAVALLALCEAGCERHAPGACREDVDCPPGFDCVAAACAHRERMKFESTKDAPPSPAEQAPQDVPAPPPPRESQPPAPAAPPVRPVKPKPAPAPEPAPLPPAPPAPEQKLPAWKERLKNT